MGFCLRVYMARYLLASTGTSVMAIKSEGQQGDHNGEGQILKHDAYHFQFFF